MIEPLDPAVPGVAERVAELQRAAYSREADLIGFDGIPTMHESVDDIRSRVDLTWLAVYDDARLVGIVAWTREEDGTIDIDRLAVDPVSFRRGHGRALVEAVLRLPGAARWTVSTGTANAPARRLYESLGFVATGEREVAPGVTATIYSRSLTA